MGNLSSCLKSKHLFREGNEMFSVGSATMQGLRKSQEDAHKVAFSIPNHPGVSFFGVFDGHGGEMASLFLAERIIGTLSDVKELDDESVRKALLKLDTEFTSPSNKKHREMGSTCIFCLIKSVKKEDGTYEYEVNCVNVGDSRCLVVHKNGEWKPLSNDHKPTDPEESKRIFDAGGCVMSARVDGSLAVSRAFGDYNFKTNGSLPQLQQRVTAEADFIHTTCHEGDVILVSCDGIFETLESSIIANFIRDNFKNHEDPAKMLSQVFDVAQRAQSADNMTGVLVHLNDGRGKPRGPQFVPGGLNDSRGDAHFLNAYKEDICKAGMQLTPQVRLVAYHQDLMDAMQSGESAATSAKRVQIMREIHALNPWKMTLADLAFLINSLNSSLMFSDEQLALAQNSLARTAEGLYERSKEDGLQDVGLTEEIVKNITVLFSLWKSIPEPASAAKGKDA